MIFKVSSLVANRSGETVKDGADDGEASSALFVFCAKREWMSSAVILDVRRPLETACKPLCFALDLARGGE